MGLAILIGLMACYSVYAYVTTGEDHHLYFLLGYVVIILFVLRDKWWPNKR